MIDRFRRKSSNSVLSRAGLATAAGTLAAVLALAGCGGDDEGGATDSPTTPAATVTAPPTESVPEAEMESDREAREAEPEPETAPNAGDGSPEDVPGGAGDEEPARTLALFTGRGGRISPRVVRVPAFISIRIELRSADGAAYGLDFDEVVVRSGGEIGSRARTIDGLRPQESVTGKPLGGAGNAVRIEATAEPGP